MSAIPTGKIEFLKLLSYDAIENIANSNNLTMQESDDCEIGVSIIALIDEEESDEVQATFILSAASATMTYWRCVFVEKELSASSKTES